MKPIILLLYISVLALLHVLPLGGGDLSAMKIILFRADYLLHSLVFLPWMFFGWFRPGGSGAAHMTIVRGQTQTSYPHRQMNFPLYRWLALGAVLAVGLEGAQYLLPYRSFNPMDAVYNLLGVMTGWGALMVLRFFSRPSVSS